MNAADVVLIVLREAGMILDHDSYDHNEYLYFVKSPHFGLNRWIGVEDGNEAGHITINVMADWDTLVSKSFNLALPDSIDELRAYGAWLVGNSYNFKKPLG